MRLALRMGCIWLELEWGGRVPVLRRHLVVPGRNRFKLQRRLLRRIQGFMLERRREEA
jgi:hypothetical protein